MSWDRQVLIMYGSLADKDTSAYSNTRITCIYEVRVFTRIHGSQMGKWRIAYAYAYRVFRYLEYNPGNSLLVCSSE